jgi:hypothetical protein
LGGEPREAGGLPATRVRADDFEGSVAGAAAGCAVGVGVARSDDSGYARAGTDRPDRRS